MENNTVYCRFCERGKMEPKEDAFTDEIRGANKIYWYECPICGSRSPIRNTPEDALKRAIFGI